MFHGPCVCQQKGPFYNKDISGIYRALWIKTYFNFAISHRIQIAHHSPLPFWNCKLSFSIAIFTPKRCVLDVICSVLLVNFEMYLKYSGLNLKALKSDLLLIFIPQLVESSVQSQCKCHGVSGSCSIRTCWRALPSRLQEIATRLVRRYPHSVAVRVGGAVGWKLLPARPSPGPLYSPDDLLYLNDSPDYCHRDYRTGSVGTHGR